MSEQENLQQVFLDFVEKARARLAEVDAKYQDETDDENICLKHIEKVDIYKHVTDRLIEDGKKLVGIVNHLESELGKLDTDVTSSASSRVYLDEKIHEDFEFLRKSVEKRISLDEEALESLVHLEGVIEALQADKQKLATENSEWKEHTCRSDCDEITQKAIESLAQENEDLKDVIKQNEAALKKLNDASSKQADAPAVVIDDNTRKELKDCMEKLETLRRQLKDRDATISHLTNQLANVSVPASTDISKTEPLDSSHSSSSNSSSSTELKDQSQSIRRKHHQRSRSDTSTSTVDDSRSLTDNEMSDNEKLRLFKDAYRELAMILKEKYQQLRKQRTKIAELMKLLEKCQQKDDEILDLKSQAANLKQQNANLSENLSKVKEDPQILDELKQQVENLKNEIRTTKERETLLARKIAMQETHLANLRDERQYLIKINNDMLNSISVCKKELSKFNVDIE